MKKKQKNLSKKQIYMNRKTGHPSKPFAQKGARVKSIGFTEDGKETFCKKTRLNHNIDPESRLPCYVKNDIEHFLNSDYREVERYKKYRVHVDDEPIINRIITKKRNKKDRT